MEKRPEDTHISPQEPSTKIDKAEDIKISRGFWRYVIIGYAIGMAIGATIFVFVLLAMQKMELQIPIIFVVAALAQIGTGGGLVGAGIYVSKTIDRDDDDDDDDEPGGGRKEFVSSARPLSPTGSTRGPRLVGAAT